MFPAGCEQVVIGSVEGKLDNFTGTIKYLPEVKLFLIIQQIPINISRKMEYQLLPMLVMMNIWNFSSDVKILKKMQRSQQS